MPFNFSSPEYLSPHKRRKNLVSPVSRASPAHMNSPLVIQEDGHLDIRCIESQHTQTGICTIIHFTILE